MAAQATERDDAIARALSVYLTSSIDYAGARAASLSAAGDQFGAGSIQQNAVAAAWTAAGRN